jgi:protoporphyrinogen oxidase
MHFDYLIIGAGVSGVACARLLQLSGVHRIGILEAFDEPGGLCRTKRIGDHVLDIGGGHFLCTRYPEVYDFIFQHIPKSEFNYFERVSRISIDGVEVDYPLESNIWQLPREQCAEYLISVVQNGEARKLPAPTDFEGWIRWKLGDLVATRYMLPYNRKIWGVEPSEMDIDWLHKIPRLDLREIVMSCLNRQSDRQKMPSHAGFFYPKAGGFQQVFDAILRPVANLVETRNPVSIIEKIPGGLLVNGKYKAKVVINTAPWKSISNSPIFDNPARQAIMALQHNGLVVSLHEQDYSTDAHWAYIPSEKVTQHRNFFIHNFAPHSANSGVYRETNPKRWSGGSGEIFKHSNECAYPIPIRGWATAIRAVLNHCEPLGLFGLGRWGQWQYFNSDVCIKEAMQLCQRLGHSRCCVECTKE